MDSEVQALAQSLEIASDFLLKHGVPGWASWLANDAKLLRSGEYYGVEHILSAFGGMGSLNDLVLCPANGHQILDAEVDRANDELQTMLGDISGRARKLARKAGR